MADEGLPYFLAASHTSSSDITPSLYIDLMLSMIAKTVGAPVRWSATRLLISCLPSSSDLPNAPVTLTNDEEHAHDNQPDDDV